MLQNAVPSSELMPMYVDKNACTFGSPPMALTPALFLAREREKHKGDLEDG